MQASIRLILPWLLVLATNAAALATPVVSNVHIHQPEGTRLVEIRYDLAGETGRTYTVLIEFSPDGGQTFAAVTGLTGAVGAGIAPGPNKLSQWDAREDWAAAYFPAVQARVTAMEELPSFVTRVPLSEFPEHAILIDFDHFADGTILTDQYSQHAIQFENARVTRGPYPISSPNLIRAVDASGPIRVFVNNSVLYFGIYIDYDGYNTERQPHVRVYDRNMNLITFWNFAQGPDFIGFHDPSGIAYLVELACWANSLPGQLRACDEYDNLYFVNR